MNVYSFYPVKISENPSAFTLHISESSSPQPAVWEPSLPLWCRAVHGHMAEEERLVPAQETSAKRCSPLIWALVGSNLLLLGEETLLLFFSSHSVVLGGFERAKYNELISVDS